MRTMATIVLTAHGMGDRVPRTDFDAWVGYVCEHIAEHLDFEVEVEAARFGEPGDDRVRAATDEHAEAVREALAELWDAWCADGAPGAR